MSKLTLKEIRSNPSIISTLPSKRKRQILDSWFKSITKTFERCQRIVEQEEEKISRWMHTDDFIQTKLSLQHDLIVSYTSHLKVQLERGELELTPEIVQQVGRKIGLTGRDLPKRQLPFQTSASVELCRSQPSKYWGSHSTEEHWWPSQWCGETLFLDELYGRHKPGEIIMKLNRYREVIIATKHENLNTLKMVQKTENFPGCPFVAYKDAGIALVARLAKLPSGR